MRDKGLGALARNLWMYRGLIWRMAARDIRSRYAGSVVGLFWSVIHPLAMIAVFTLVFSHLLKMSPFSGEDSYIFYLVAGLLPWIGFQEVIQRSSTAFVDNAALIKKIPFPLEVLVANILLAGTFNLLLSLGIFVIILPLAGDLSQWGLLLLPLVIFLQVVFELGLVLFLATLTVFYRDIAQVTGVALFLWFWLTPVVYKVDFLSPGLRKLFMLNPFYHLAELYRASFLGSDTPALPAILALVGVSILFLWIGSRVFDRLKREVPEVV